MTDKEKFHQLIMLYELGIVAYTDSSDFDIIYALRIDSGMCRASKLCFEDYYFTQPYNRPRRHGWWWATPDSGCSSKANLRALQVRLDWLYEQLNKIK